MFLKLVVLVCFSFPEGWHCTASIQSPMIPEFSNVNDINASSTSILLLRALAKHMFLVIFVHGDSHRLAGYRRCKGISNTILISQLPAILSDFYSSVWWTQFFLLLGGIVSNF